MSLFVFPGTLPETVIQHHGKTLFKRMKSWKKQNNLPPVVLFTGPAGIGKREIIHFLAQWVLCKQNGPSSSPNLHQDTASLRPCGTCSSCLKVLSGNQVNLTEILSEQDPGALQGPEQERDLPSQPSSQPSFQPSGHLKIDQFRKVKASAGFGAHEGQYKILLIPAADRMTQQAANSVLKLLEEPPSHWLFFLTATDSTLLLPTLVSRCQVIRLRSYSTVELTCLLNSSPTLNSSAAAPPEAPNLKERISIYAKLAQGSWKRALNFASEEFWNYRKDLLEFIQKPSGNVLSLIDSAARDNTQFEILIDLLEQITAELIEWSINPNKYVWMDPESEHAFQTHAQNTLHSEGSMDRAREFWLSRAEQLTQARTSLLAPLNKKILAQDLLLPWLQTEKRLRRTL